MSEPLIIIGNEATFQAAINPLGAELSSLRDQHGRDLLWDGDPAVWSGRAPVLFPIVGSLRDGHYRYAGQQYALPRHGFGRHSAFTLVDHRGESATLRLGASEATRAVYPFEFELDLTFAVAPGAIAIGARINNRGAVPMPASFGFHPALRWPLPFGGARENHRIEFERPEPQDIGRLDADGLLARHEASPLAGRDLALRDELFAADALVFTGLASRSVRYGAAGSPQLRVDFPAMPDLGIWTKPGAGFVCIEPWQGTSDPAGFDGDIFAKPGVMVLAPGCQCDLGMTITLEVVPPRALDVLG